MTTEERDFNRKQLKECFIDLAKRARDTDEPYIYSVALVLAGSIIEKSDASLALWVGEFAKLRIDQIDDTNTDE